MTHPFSDRAGCFATGLAFAFLLSACSGSSGKSPPAVTFHKDVESILQKSCQPCHTQGGIAPMPLMTYADAKAYGAMMVAQTSAGTMPPWGAVETPDCTPRFKWKDDARLTGDAIATIRQWQEQGAVEGDPKDAPPPVQLKAPGLDGAQTELTPLAPYTIPDASTDQFRCFVLDPQFTSTNYIDGTFIVPGNATIVHHALVFADSTGASKALITDPSTNSYDCFGGPGFTNTTLVSAWAPGGVPVEYPADVGTQIDAGTLLVMQVHYHPHSAAAVLTPDQTKLQMRFMASKPSHLATATLLGNFDFPVAATGALAGIGLLPGPDDPPSGPVFDIPPGINGHTETMEITIPARNSSLRLVGIGGHSHYVGSAIEIRIARTNPQETAAPANECLIAQPNWDFNWQRFYQYDTPLDALPTAMPGDVLTVKCTYNNTMGNKNLAVSLADRGLNQPQDVKLGETTLDEMCLGAFLIIP
jgi:Copper type II ascorbate-dependent monooxygenase, N-terminal domain/Copper type II ascorbate-dependent monooxygenase, C-terminal domain